jgi:hypothetical protein
MKSNQKVSTDQMSLFDKVEPTTKFIQNELEKIEEKRNKIKESTEILNSQVEQIVEQFKKEALKKLEKPKEKVSDLLELFKMNENKIDYFDFSLDSDVVLEDLKFSCENLIQLFDEKSTFEHVKYQELNTIFHFFNIESSKNILKEVSSIRDKLNSSDFLDSFLEYVFLFYDLDRNGFIDDSRFELSLCDILNTLAPLTLKKIGEKFQNLEKDDLSILFGDDFNSFKKDKISILEFKKFFNETVLTVIKKSINLKKASHLQNELMILGLIQVKDLKGISIN